MFRSISRLHAGLLLISPAMIFIAVFFVVPTCLLLLYSFWSAQGFRLDTSLTLSSYERAIFDPAFRSVTITALKVGFFTAAISLAASIPVAYWMVFKSKSQLLLYVILLTWFSSYLVRIYGWRTILGSNGLINSGLISSGLTTEPLDFILFNQFSVIVTLTHIYLPLALLLIVASMQEIKSDYLEAARDLGAGTYAMVMRVLLPLSMSGLVSTFMFIFVLAAGDYVTPQMVGGRTGITTGLLIAEQFRKTGDWPYGAAMTFILFALFFLIYFVLVRVLKHFRLMPRTRHRRAARV